jgi:alpha-tubulin suppressor-like RCC1 family protein
VVGVLTAGRVVAAVDVVSHTTTRVTAAAFGSIPRRQPGRRGGTNVYNTGALGSDGTIWTWGTNYGGALGNEGFVEISPLQISDASTNWTDLTAGYICYIAKK